MEKLFTALTKIVQDSKVVVDRPKGTPHPRYSDAIYPMDYGYLEGTSSQDGGGIDVWIGGGDTSVVNGILVVADPVKKDSEVKILLGCSKEEMQTAHDFNNFNHRDSVAAYLIENREKL